MVSLLLLCKNKKFLMVKRSPSEHNYSGYWGLPGGGVDENETPTDALIRELNIELPNFRLLNRYNHKDTTIYVFLDLIYLYVHVYMTFLFANNHKILLA